MNKIKLSELLVGAISGGVLATIISTIFNAIASSSAPLPVEQANNLSSVAGFLAIIGFLGGYYGAIKLFRHLNKGNIK